MAINTVLFDLDGTLLPMDEDKFIKLYFYEISKKAAEFGYEEKTIVNAVWAATMVMLKNDGAMKNCDVFWKAFQDILGEEAKQLQEPFNSFYANEFHRVKAATRENPLARQLVTLLKERGFTLAVATNPVFPMVANHSRLSWVGLCESDFSHITTYENSRFCKPNVKYYADILTQLDKKPEETLMVGNDVLEDMAAAELGMDTFLVTDCLHNPTNADYSRFRQGGFADLMDYFENL